MRVEHEKGGLARLAGGGRRRGATGGQQFGREKDGEAGKSGSLRHLTTVEDCPGQESSHCW
jgi:hypothetical protein